MTADGRHDLRINGDGSASGGRGNNITIGKNCDIDLVEYRNSFEQTDNAKVRKSIKI
ncbi:MAG: hypothetical protein ABSA86_08940 [Oryzomonas sp.]|jgi:hypothetical protein